MHNNLNRQILQGAARISVNTCVFSDAYIFHDNVIGIFIFLPWCFKLTINVNINVYCVRVTQKRQIYRAFVRNLN